MWMMLAAQADYPEAARIVKEVRAELPSKVEKKAEQLVEEWQSRGVEPPEEAEQPEQTEQTE